MFPYLIFQMRVWVLYKKRKQLNTKQIQLFPFFLVQHFGKYLISANVEALFTAVS